MGSAAEVARLHVDTEKRNAYLEKLAAKEAFFNQETDRRNGELADLEWVIDVFQEQVASLSDTLRNRIDDYVHDERFDSMFNRETDANVEAGVEGAFSL